MKNISGRSQTCKSRPSVSSGSEVIHEPIPVDVDEWRAAYAALGPAESDPGMSTKELSELWGIGRTPTIVRIKTLVNAGTLRPGTRRVRDSSGRWCNVPVYEIVQAQKQRGK